MMQERGWNSSDQLQKAKNELIEKGVISVEELGGKMEAVKARWQEARE